MIVTQYTAKDIDNVLSKMDNAEIEKLPCGAIQLDKGGKILFYNSAEGKITGRSPASVVGKNFFNDVAPCTKTPAFHGEFLKVVRDGTHQAKFQYTFDYEMKATKVTVQLKKAIVGDTYWVLVNRM
ncbi:MAG: photoactive yellow protein [Bryobacteraceae bacterium]|nr:photoactive yellow protein [Bryobacteraceae bacterium]